MEKKIIIATFFLLPMISFGQTKMSDVLATMPDSLFPYLSKNNRLDMIDFIASSMKAEVSNGLGGISKLLKLNSDYLKMQASATTLVEMKLLPDSVNRNDTAGKQIVCMVTTFGESHPKESKVEFFTTQWKPLHNKWLMPAFMAGTNGRKEKSTVIASLSATDKTLTLQQVALNPKPKDNNNDEEDFREPENLQNILKWNGRTFK